MLRICLYFKISKLDENGFGSHGWGVKVYDHSTFQTTKIEIRQTEKSIIIRIKDPTLRKFDQ